MNFIPRWPLTLPKVIGHRGACGYAPENTLASLYKAQALGVAWVEFDVMLTHDSKPIIIHDETLNRTTNGRGAVATVNYNDLSHLDAGSWFSPLFAGEKIPTLSEFLQCAQRLNLGINVEIKPAQGHSMATAYHVVAELKQYSALNNKLISSFSLPSLAIARALDSSLPLGLLVDHWFPDWWQVLEQLNCAALHANHSILTREIVTALKASGRYVLAYTVDDPHQAQQLFSWGVDAVFSNIPDMILEMF